MYHFYNCHQIWLCSALSKYTFLESTKQRSLLYPPPHPSPSCTSPVTDIWWVETLLLSISERIHFYKKNSNLTDTICMIDGTTRWGVSLTLSIMFRRRVFPIGLLLLILPAWHTYFYLGGRVHGWPRHESLSHGASFRACTNVETPS